MFLYFVDEETQAKRSYSTCLGQWGKHKTDIALLLNFLTHSITI